MRISISLLKITILSLFFIDSCSSKDEEETAASVVEPPQQELEPDPVNYSLSVSASEGGTVSTNGGDYEEGTEITITATPDEG